MPTKPLRSRFKTELQPVPYMRRVPVPPPLLLAFEAVEERPAMSLKQRQKHEQRRAAAQSQSQRPLPGDVLASRVASALHLHQTGNVPAAEAIYREVLHLQPRHPDALHYLGTALFQRRQLAEAADLMERSIAAAEQHGSRATFYSNYGLVLHDLGKLDEAAAVYGRALKLRPDYPEALNNLGNTLQAQEKLDEALADYRRAIALQPGYVQAYCNAGAVLKKQDRLGEAEEAYRTALGLNPRNAEAHYNLGNTLHAQGRLDEAIEHYRVALAEKPDHTKAHNNWGNVLTDQGKLEEAIAHYEQALAIDPHAADARYNLGNTLYAQGKLEEAGDQYESVRQEGPLSAKTCVNWGAVREDQGKVADAISLYEKACRIFEERPGNAPDQENVVAHMNLAMALLVSGNFADGLAHYEWRHHSDSPSTAARYPHPLWRGEGLDGRRILLHREQGLGDTLHLLRYAPMVRARGGRVVLQVQPCLERLAAAMSPEFTVVAEGQPLPPFDLHCPWMSLPFAFGTRLETIPAEVPYLRVPEEEMAYAASLPWPANGLKVGLVWAGSPSHVKDKLRSITLSQLAPLFATPETHFFSLQVGTPVEQARAFPAIEDLSPDPDNMADTAAKLAHLDLLIAVDTSVVHLAGALGKPVWLMLPFTPDWRWLRDRDDSPWYPTMRLFRQPERHDWTTVVDQVAAALRERSESHRRDRLS